MVHGLDSWKKMPTNLMTLPLERQISGLDIDSFSYDLKSWVDPPELLHAGQHTHKEHR